MKYLEPEWEYYSFCKIEHGQYWIETEITITRGVRVKVRIIDDRFGYMLNWCAGDQTFLVPALIWAIVHAIDKEMLIENLPHPEIRPFNMDNEFMYWLDDHVKDFQIDPVQQVLLGEYLKINYVESFKKLKFLPL